VQKAVACAIPFSYLRRSTANPTHFPSTSYCFIQAQINSVFGWRNNQDSPTGGAGEEVGDNMKQACTPAANDHWRAGHPNE
jgi:hypothetical protein